MKYQGIIIKLTRSRAIVTTDDFQCYYIKRSSTVYVGKQIEFSQKEIIREQSVQARLMVSVACVLFIITFLLNFTGVINMRGILSEPKVFAYVDVDINPSLQIEIDDTGKVLKLVPFDDDARVLIKKLRIGKVSINEAVGNIIDEVKKNTSTSEDEKNYVLVSSTLNNKKDNYDKEYQDGREKLDIIIDQMKERLQADDKVEVYLVQASIYEREYARSEDMSTGRYVLYNNYKNSENSFSIEEAKNANVNELLKGMIDDKTEGHSQNNKPGLIPSPLKTGDNGQNAYATPASNKNDTEETDLKLNTPSPTLIPSPILTPTPKQTSRHTTGLATIPTSESTPKVTATIEPIQTQVKSPIPQQTESGNLQFMRFESYNYRQHFIRHESYKLRISTNIAMLEDSMYKVVPGLADPDCISFESKNYPGYYLKHENFKIILKKYDGSEQFNADATFRKVPGLADTNYISFQSYNHPDRYIRHREFFLYIENIATDIEKKDATYIGIEVE